MTTTWHSLDPDLRCRWCVRGQATLVIVFEDEQWLLCPEHAETATKLLRLRDDNRVDRLVRDPRIAACVVGAITGATPPDLAEMLRAGCTDPSMLDVALDHIEQHGLYLPEAWPTVADAT